ncbi:equilibrative nucleoside transporter 1 [Anaeramoeba flamelloides]|uniref:Equilibrative nucleoside transporter 1 n=1 Tax=Anaeramoeba flamelloides TaxID=1746091 RepID=A0AAV7YL76_9EUKA|nr:equilibrative nucleoside transporter 1 isoform a [Anaeramoeba flamelloides]KAJ6234935.1 equilibrative nucleoside transporter 1 [Anaeramoeba flamelloides]
MNQQKNPKPNQEPKLIYTFFILMGIAHLLPYNALIVAYNYFSVTLGTVAKNFEFQFILIFNLTVGSPLIGSLILTWSRHRRKSIAKISKQNFSLRIVPGLIGYIVLTFSIPFVINYTPITLSFKLIMIEVGLIGISTGLVQSGLFAYVSTLPPKYIVAIITGQAISGTVISVIGIITKFTNDYSESDIKISSIIYFSICSFITLIILIGYLKVIKSDFGKKYSQLHYSNSVESFTKSKSFKNKNNKNENANENENGKENKNENKNENNNKSENDIESDQSKTKIKNIKSPYQSSDEDKKLVSLSSDSEDFPENQENGFIESEQLVKQAWKRVSIWDLFLKLLPLELNLVFIYIVTLSLFPSIVVKIPSTYHKLNKTGWYPMILITLFNICDLLGRLVVNYATKIKSNAYLYILVVSRLAFCFLFVLMVRKTIFNDFLTYLFVIIFGLSNGFCSCLTMMKGPTFKNVLSHEKDNVGVILSFFLQIGLFAGSSLSYAMIPFLPK